MWVPCGSQVRLCFCGLHPLAKEYWWCDQTNYYNRIKGYGNILFPCCDESDEKEQPAHSTPLSPNADVSTDCSSLTIEQCRTHTTCRYNYGVKIEKDFSCYSLPKEVGCLSASKPCGRSLQYRETADGSCWVFYDDCLPDHFEYRETNKCNEVPMRNRERAIPHCTEQMDRIHYHEICGQDQKSSSTTSFSLAFLFCPTQAYRDEQYRCTLGIKEAVGEDFRYHLVTHPVGMVIDEGTGEVMWTPTSAEHDYVDFEVEVTRISTETEKVKKRFQIQVKWRNRNTGSVITPEDQTND